MEGHKQGIHRLIIICVTLAITAGTIGFFSGNLIPREIEPATEAAKFIDQTTLTSVEPETTSAVPTPKENFDVLEAALGVAANVAQDAPRFLYLMANKLFTAHVEDVNSNSNVFSVVKNATTK